MSLTTTATPNAAETTPTNCTHSPPSGSSENIGSSRSENGSETILHPPTKKTYENLHSPHSREVAPEPKG